LLVDFVYRQPRPIQCVDAERRLRTGQRYKESKTSRQRILR
jgi:hypothetical protein